MSLTTLPTGHQLTTVSGTCYEVSSELALHQNQTLTNRPIGVGADLFINTMLWLFGLFPGVIHGWYIILKSPSQASHTDNSAHEGERKYIVDSAPIHQPMPEADTRGSRDGTEVRPFPSPIVQEGGMAPGQGGGFAFEDTAHQGPLPTYESVAGGSSDSTSKPARTDSKSRS